MPDPGVTVLYDGGCRFCRASAAAMAAWDRRRRLTILPFADPEARRVAAAVPEESRFRSVHAARGGDVASEDAAIARILGELPGGGVLRAARVQSLYGLVARHRGPIGRLLPDLRVTRRVPYGPTRAPIRRPSTRSAPEAVACTHADRIRDVTPSAEGCQDCLRDGGTWVHLRMCLTCGHVGCCDSSPNRHATAHFRATGHPIVRSIEPGESWRWCYADEVMV